MWIQQVISVREAVLMLAGHWGFCLDHCCAVMTIKASLDFRELWAGKELKRIQTEACFLSRNSQSGCTYTMKCKSKKILHGCMYLRLCAHVCKKRCLRARLVVWTLYRWCVLISECHICVLSCVCCPYLTLIHEWNVTIIAASRLLAQKTLINIYNQQQNY